MEACSSGDTSPEVNVIFSNIKADTPSGSTVVDLRLVVGSQFILAPGVPAPTTVCLSQLLRETPITSSRIASPFGEKSDKVCCHWKNKGWCKYAGTCKFQH